MKDDLKIKMPNKPQDFNSFGWDGKLRWGGKLGWGVKIWWQAKG